MTTAAVGSALGAAAGAGLLLVAGHVARRRRPSLDQRVAPYLGRVAGTAGRGAARGVPDDDALRLVRLLRPSVEAVAARLDGVLGGSASLRSRLARAGSARTLEQFRLEQLACGAGGFLAVFVVVVTSLAGGSRLSLPAAVVLCLAAGASGVLAREQVLNREVRRRAERVAAEFPTVAELLALAVAAGEGAPGALARVARVCSGELAGELSRVLDDTRTGRGLAEALRGLAARVDVPAVARFVDGVVIAVDRGTPLADVLRAQAADAREARRRELMESAGRREIAMLVPVVFLILPVTVVFALFPGFYGLSLSVP